MPDAKPKVHEAWSHVMAAVQAVGKTGYNRQQEYSFRGVDAVVNAAGPAMREHGVIVAPTVKEAQYRDVEVGRNRTLMREVTVKVRYSVIGPGGDVLEVPNEPDFGTVWGESLDSGDKGTAKAMSVAYRIFLLQALSIPTDEIDPDEQSHKRTAVKPKPQPQAHGQESRQPPPGHIWPGQAKSAVLAEMGSDKDAAAKAWQASGLDGVEWVSEDQLGEVLAKLHTDDRPMTQAQSKRLHALLRQKRNASGDARFPVLTELLDREIASSNDVTVDEAKRLIDTLGREDDYGDNAEPAEVAP